MSFTEFSYMTLQAADFLHLHRARGVDRRQRPLIAVGVAHPREAIRNRHLIGGDAIDGKIRARRAHEPLRAS